MPNIKTNISGNENAALMNYFYVMKPYYCKTNFKKERAKKYLLKYTKELKVHFDLTENELKNILLGVYYSKTVLCQILRHLRRFFKESI